MDAPARTAVPLLALGEVHHARHLAIANEDADKQYLGSSFSPSFSDEEGWITVGRTAGYGDEGNADVFRILIEDGEVVREVNLTKSEKWDSAPVWGSHPPVG